MTKHSSSSDGPTSPGKSRDVSVGEKGTQRGMRKRMSVGWTTIPGRREKSRWPEPANHSGLFYRCVDHVRDAQLSSSHSLQPAKLEQKHSSGSSSRTYITTPNSVEVMHLTSRPTDTHRPARGSGHRLRRLQSTQSMPFSEVNQNGAKAQF